MTPEELSQYNNMIKRWSAMVRRKLYGSVLRFRKGKPGAITRGLNSANSRTEYKLKDNLSYKPGYSYGQIESVSYRFERHGVFVHKGVGRGYIMSGGVVVRGYKPSKEAKAYAKAKNRAIGNTILSGPVRRQPADWFNPIMDQNVPELADKVAQMNADAIVNALRLRIV